jgi:hypothetical protein
MLRLSDRFFRLFLPNAVFPDVEVDGKRCYEATFRYFCP